MAESPFGLGPDEHGVARVDADGFFASKHGFGKVSSAQIHLTTERFVALEQRGLLRKRLEVIGEWHWTEFTERVNTSVGGFFPAGPNMLTLFTKDEESISSGFREGSSLERFRELVAAAMLPHLD